MLLNHRVLGQGPPLLILHGLFGSLDNWMTLAKQLAADYTVYLVDLRNHGQSFHDSQFNYTVMAEDIQKLVEALKLSDIYLLGHSLGGKTAMFYTAHNQPLVRKLIVVDISPKYYTNRQQLILDALAAIDMNTLTSRREADDILSRYISEEGIRLFLMKNLKRKSADSFEWKINLPVLNAQIDQVGEALPSSFIVQAPSLFIRGGASDYITDEDEQHIPAQFPNSNIHTIPGAGHWVHAEAPQELLATVKEFLG